MHHEQDMRYYGALRKHIPLTYWAMIAGTLAITGVGILGVFGFAGFYSKDIILESAYASGTYGQMAFFVGATAALLTSFYSWRLIFLTFHGKARWDQSEHIQHAVHGDHHDHPDAEDAGHDHTPAHSHASHGDGTAGYHPHESPLSMLIPLGVLTLGAIFAGFVFHHSFVDSEHGIAFWAGSIAFNEHLMHAAHEVPLWVKLTPAAVMLLGLFIAWRNYIRDPGIPARIVASIPDLHKFLMNKWYFDELYDVIFVRPAQALGRIFWHRGDEQTIDRFGPNGAATAIAGGSVLTARLQSGFLYSYAFVMLLGLAALVTWAMAVYS
jgi:NADH-quinone oxidoreductase subunit L